MPAKTTVKRAKKAKQEGKAPSTQAGEFVREVIDDIRQGKHGARSTKQAIAIGLSKARRAGVKLPPPKKGTTSETTRQRAERDYQAGQKPTPRKKSAKRSKSAKRALQREGTAAASEAALSKQAKTAAKKRTPAERSAAAKKAARTKGRVGLVKAARKAASARAANA